MHRDLLLIVLMHGGRVMKIANILPTTFADGERARTSIYFAGCDIQCEGCHNKDLWNINTGHEMSVDQIINYIEDESLQTKQVSILGGEPTMQLNSLQALLKALKGKGYNIWLYTGKLFEDLINMDILIYIDILVDGPYIQELKKENLKYRGSSNQRIIDVQKSLKENKIIIYME